MAATKFNALQALSAAALSLPGMVPELRAALPAENPQVDFQYGHYEESNERISVDIFQGIATIPLAQKVELSASWAVDTFSGATPVLTMPSSVVQITTGASKISVDGSVKVKNAEPAVQIMTGASTKETRYGAGLALRYFLNDIVLSASGNRSEERDYLSHAYHIGLDWEFNQKLSSLTLGFGQNFDQVKPKTRSLRAEKTDNHFQLGFSQVMSKKSLLRASINYTHSDGFLSNPYKKVFIQGLSNRPNLDSDGNKNVFFENRPDKRDRWSVTLGYIHYLPEWDSALHLDYRYYTDSWNIHSHTLKMALYQPLPDGWMVVPRIRYYSQTQAGFYQDFFAAPRPDNHYSSDYRLAGFGNLSGGLKLTKAWSNPGELAERIKFEVGIDYTAHQSGLKLGQKTSSDLTDFYYFLVMASFQIQF